MKHSQLFQLISACGRSEIKEIRKFLRSPFFNTRNDLIVLFDYLTSTEEPEKTKAWQTVTKGQEPYNDQKCRLLMSYLHRLIEQYLSVVEMTEDDLSSRLYLVRAYRRRSMNQAFDRSTKILQKQLYKQPLRDARFHRISYLLQFEQNRLSEAQNPADASHLHQAAVKFDLHYLTVRLRIICLALSQKSVYRAEPELDLDDEIVALAKKHPMNDLPSMHIYLVCHRMLTQPEDVTSFREYKSLLLRFDGIFAAEEMRALYLMAVNYCIRRLNDGNEAFFPEVLDLYKPGLESGYLLENGVLSRFTYHNIVAAGLRTGELDWVKFFIHAYKNSLERKYRESSFHFNLARLEYTRRNYDAVLELLQKANYRDPLLNLAAKTLLMKTYYELDEYDLLQSHLDAMRNYIRRKRVLGYHRSNYLNIVRYADKLLKINFLNKKEVERLLSAIDSEEVLTEKEWFLEQLA